MIKWQFDMDWFNRYWRAGQPCPYCWQPTDGRAEPAGGFAPAHRRCEDEVIAHLAESERNDGP